MKIKPVIWLFFAVALVLPLVAWNLYRLYEKDVMELPVIGKNKDHRVSEFQLINQDGKSRGLQDWNDKIVVADFFFTHCPVICPKMTANLANVVKAFENDKNVLLNSFSIDPERDSVERLRRYADRFDINTDQWDLLTGDKKEIYRLARNSFMVVATDGDGGPEDFIHSDKFVLVDKQRRIRGYYTGTSEKETEQLIADIKKLQHEK